jgi:hypothetical protein
MKRFFVVALLGCFACGDNGNGTEDMSVPEDLSVAADLRAPADLYNPDFAGIACGAQTCMAMTQECCATIGGGGGVSAMCVAMGTCNRDGGASPIGCDGPEDCASGTPTCCVELGGSGGGDAGIMGSGGSMCTTSAACMARAVPAGAGLEATTRLCHAAADCAGLRGPVTIPPGVPQFGGQTLMLNFDSCCSSTQFQGVEFCAPGLAQMLLQGLSCK